MTRREHPGGTVTHIPPENWRDINTWPTEKYDVYSFGILLWELLSENYPFCRGKFESTWLTMIFCIIGGFVNIDCD